jgi:hypothetical protein
MSVSITNPDSDKSDLRVATGLAASPVWASAGPVADVQLPYLQPTLNGA